MTPVWAGFLLSLSLCLDLGIVNVAVLRTTLEQGGTAGFLLGVGSCVGDLVYFMLAAAGAAALLQWRAVRLTLWLVGTAVLLLLAWRMIREVIRPRHFDIDATAAGQRRAPWDLILQGLGLALASPTSILWFAAVGGSVIASFGGGKSTVWPFAVGFAAAAVLWSAIFAYGLAALKGLMGDKLIRMLSTVSAAVFLYLAGVVFVTGARQWMH